MQMWEGNDRGQRKTGYQLTRRRYANAFVQTWDNMAANDDDDGSSWHDKNHTYLIHSTQEEVILFPSLGREADVHGTHDAA